MKAMLFALALSFASVAQAPHVAVHPVNLQSGDGSVVFQGVIVFMSGSAPIMLGTLTVDGDTIDVPPAFMQTLSYGLWWKWSLPGGHRLTVGTYPDPFTLEGILVTEGTGGSGITTIPLN